MTTDTGDLVNEPTGVRRGTRVWVYSPAPALPVNGEGANFPPLAGRLRGKKDDHPPCILRPIEEIQPDDYVLSHDGKPHRVLHVTRTHYRGEVVGISHSLSLRTTWLTSEHRVLSKPRPRTLGGQRDWSATPHQLRVRRQELRRDATPAEQKLWSVLRKKQTGFKFRRQHPIGPYIADFYSRDAQMVIEVDGDSHFTPQGLAHDHERDRYLFSMGLDVLHFTNEEVETNLEGVYQAIWSKCRSVPDERDSLVWHEAGTLEWGDTVYFGPDLQAVNIDSIEYEDSEEEVYDMTGEGTHSFLTEVCVVHNCGSGTTAYVAEG